MQLPPLSLYIHVPWCVRKCPYCDFNSHQAESQTIPEEDYIKALANDIAMDSHWAQGRSITSIFFGGGTPSLLSPTAIGNILQQVNQVVPISKDAEITLEANPGTVEFNKFKGFHDAGINRLSIGVQSFQPEHLSQLGRIHDSNEAINAIKAAHQAGFDNFNIDLMHGLPGQTAVQACADLKQAFELGPTHLSWYQLTIEANTLFYTQRPELPDEEVLEEIQQRGIELIHSHGFKQYEVSAYAKELTPISGSKRDYRSRHNLNYWHFGDYLAIGAGAHGKITLPHQDPPRIIRFQKTRLPKDYLAKASQIVVENSNPFTSQVYSLEAQQLPFEFMMNQLRLLEPFDLKEFETKTNLPLGVIQSPLEKAEQMDLIKIDQNQLEITELGRRFLNTLLELFLD